jgi:hypothetical protein
VRKLLALLALLALLPAAAAAVPVAARTPSGFEVQLAPTSITVGDPVAVSARLRLARLPGSEISATLANVGATWGKATVLDAPRLEREGDGAELVWTFRITAFEPGRIELPPLEARLDLDPPRSERSAAPPALDVRSVLPEHGGDLALAPPAPPRPLPLPPSFWVLAAGLGAALAASALLLARRPAARLAEAVPRLPPLAELDQALAGLDADGPEAGHRLLSTALRRYLGRRCGFPALESTTTEVARRLAARGLDSELPRRARRLLVACDGVKFARRAASASELATRREEAAELAREIETALAPTAPPESRP